MKMLDKAELIFFKANIQMLTQNLYQYLIMNKWKDEIDKNVKLEVVKMDHEGLTVQLKHTMLDEIYKTEFFTWEEINGFNTESI